MHVLAVVREGRQRIDIADGPTVRVDAGQAVLLRRGIYTVSDLLAPGEGRFEADLLYFSGRGLRAATRPTTSFRPQPFTFLTDLPRTCAPALDLLAGLPQIDTVLVAPHRHDPLEFLRRHYDKPLTLDDLAYLTGMSVSSFQRRFRERTGRSPRSWITEQRMKRARHLLRQTNRRVADIAGEVGYRSSSHFIELYRRAYGRTPLTESRHFADE
jgi:AraC-like DNA-binding protein